MYKIIRDKNLREELSTCNVRTKYTKMTLSSYDRTRKFEFSIDEELEEFNSLFLYAGIRKYAFA